MAGQLGYTAPSVMDLFNTNFDSFNGETLPNGQSKAIAFNLFVHDVDHNWYVTCATSSNCYVQYLRDYTPYLTAVTPANVYKDQLIEFHVNAKNTQSSNGTPADAWPFREIRLGNTLVYWGSDDSTDGTVTQDKRLAGYTHATIEAIVGDQLPAANSEPKLLFYPGYAYNLPSSKTCNFAGDDCWTVRSHPKLESLSSNAGYTNGGQSLTINGWGLNGKNIEVKVDGVPCTVTASQNDAITCITGQAPADSDTVLPKLGQPGLLREKIKSTDPTKYPYWNAFSDGLYPVVEKNLMTSFETYAFAQDKNYQQKLSGWFTAPETANYRFYISCDDNCKLLLDAANPFSSGTPVSPTTIAYSYQWTQWRNYFHENVAEGINDQHISDWIPLVKGESYYIEGQHIQWSGLEHFTVSLEIQLPTPNPQHPMSNSQIQQLSVDQINTPEQWTLLVTNADSGSYRLNFLNPTTTPASLAGPYGPISTKASANTFRDAIAPYYQKYFGSAIQVDLTMYDVNQVVTTQTSAAKSFSYKVTVLKQIKGYSINSITATKVGTNATITPTPPIKAIKSSAPINGSYSIVCTDPNGKSWTTPDINYGTNTDIIQNIITNSIPFLADKIDVMPDYRYRYAENGVSFMLRFSGIKGDVTPCRIQSGVNTTLSGNSPTFNNTVLAPAGQSLMFEPIPLEFLSTYTQSPQVLVTVDGFAALCANLTCDYQYFSDAASISSQTKSGSDLAVTGVQIPSADIIKVVYGTVDCAVSTATDSNIDCKLADIPVAGMQTVQVTTVNGLIPVDVSFSPTQESLLVTSVTPNTNINYLGGDLLVIQGSGFGTNATALNITFDDGTVCDVLKCTTTAVVCQTERFSRSAVSPLTLRIAINEAYDVSQTISLLSQAQTSESVTPNRVSPVLKQNLLIQLSSNYSGTVDINDFSVFLINDNDPKTLKPLYIISVDNTAKTLKVKFPGAHSGSYSLRVVSQIHGRINTDDLKITVIGQVLDYQPKQGSIYGGTKITITGENFSNDPLDNPVKIGDNYCYVETSTATQITCKTDLLPGEAPGDETFIVFLKTSEEAVCGGSAGCSFTYVTPQATVLDVTSTFDPVSQSHIATVTGSGFDSSVRLVLDGIEQTQLAVSDTSATFQIVNIDDSNVTHVEVFTSEGYPAGVGGLTYLELTPSLLSISPLVGSAGGSRIIVTGTGFGPGTQNLNLYDSKTKKLLCSKVKVLSYGSFSCLTNPVVITDGSGIQLAYGSSRINSQDIGATSYTQLENIVLTNASLSSQTITITGSGFSGAGLVAVLSFGEIDADSTTVVSDTEVLADFTSTGVAAITAAPVLRFISTSNLNIVHYALNNSTVKITKTLTVDNTATPSVTCSFQGGCKYSVAADGLFAALKDRSNTIDVCGNPCQVDSTQSTSTQTVCSLPSVATAYSVANFKIQESGVLTGTVFPANTPVLTDGDLTIDYVSKATTGCNFGMTFPAGQVAVLDEAKIFINFMTSVTPYANQLSFYGSNDNWATSTLIDTIGSNVHEGWNYLNYRDEGSNRPAFNSYKFQGTALGACRVTEFRLTGVQSFADNSNSFTCTPKVIIGSTSTSLSTVTFDAAATPLLTSIWPRFGSVLGGDTVTLTGENFSATSTTTVKFDNRPCQVISQTTTQIVCTTADKPYVPDTPKVEIYIQDQGLVATQGLVFRYVSLWSEPQTWGFDIPPQEGESISIPKGQHLLVDIDETPKVFAVIVEGSLIFAPDADTSHHRSFDAHYIMVQGGYMEVGTEDFPYTSHLTITMHSNKYSPYLPIYGNKVIGVRFGQLEMHGVTRQVTWTTLSQTANAGDTQLVLDKNVDWNIGEEIVIAGTVFENVQSETRFITAVNGNTITLDQPLEFSHLGEVPSFGGIDIPMKAEVGLLTRNVLYRGDPETSSANQYGAHIMIHSPGDESSIGRICYIELKDVGQAFKLGRYPIHFHMIGSVHQSHVIGNAIHQTYNRAVTTHGVHYFTVQHNVAYDTMGHTYFIEDAAETNNYYDHNLAIKVKQSMSLLNTDQSPAGFWITHPNNIFTNNAIANTEAYGFWFDMKEHSTGPSFDVNICGFNDKLGQFSNNTAHSVHKYGLRLFHGLIPRTYPCQSLVFDGDYVENGKTDPYWKNPVIPAVFEDSVFWRNGHNGAIMERAGAVIFKNLKCVENGIAGMEFSLTEDIADGYAKISGGIVVGDAGLTPEISTYLRSLPRVTGVITPRTENFTVEGVTFFNYDWGTSSALKDCSHCWHPASTDSGARTVKTSGLTFDDATVPKRIRYEVPFRGIWLDLDGSLTGLGPNTWATRDFIHNRQPECTVNDDVYNGIICDNTVQVRRIVFHGYTPQSLDAMLLKIAQWDDSQAAAITADNKTLFDFQQDVDHTMFSRVEYRQKLAPMKSWAVPFVTGHKYRLHWGWSNDFDTMSVTPSNRWLPSDKNVHIMTNFTDVRVAINVTTKYGKGELIPNKTYLNKLESEFVTGDNVIYNQTEVREFKFVVNGKNATGRGQLLLTGIRCWPGSCLAPVVVVPVNSTEVYWSDPTAWPSGKVPVENDTVSIDAGVNMILDINTPILQLLTIKGRLRFLQNDTAQDLTLNARIVFVAGGELIIGNSTAPYNGTATIKLYGISTDQTLAFDSSIYGGNKMLANLGLVSFWGQSRDRNSRLRQPIYTGNNTALVSPGLDWVAGDRIYLAPTATQYTHSDYMTIANYDIQTGLITFTENVKYYHWGDYQSTASAYNGVDMRGEVVLLTRNVRVIGDDTMSWGGQIVTSDTLDDIGNLVSGQLFFNNVEVYNCSQENTYQAAIRFEGASTKHHLVQNTVVHNGHAWSFLATMSANILIKDSDFIGAQVIGFSIQTSSNITVDGVMQADVVKRKLTLGQGNKFADKEGCFSICAYNGPEVCPGVSIKNSVATGCTYAGFVVPGHTCGQSATQQVFRNNIAHSSEGSGAIIFPDGSDEQLECYEGSFFSAYKCGQAGIATMFQNKRMNMTQITMIDNVLGIALQQGKEFEVNLIQMNRAVIYGETAAKDCPDPKNRATCLCVDKMGFMLSGANEGGKDPHINKPSSLPMYKIKSYGAYNAATDYQYITFSNWLTNTTDCGAFQSIFAVNPYSSDYIPLQKFTFSKFVNVADEAMAYIYDPPEKWNNPDDCIAFPCTAPSNVVITHDRVQYEGTTKPSITPSSFQIVSDKASASQNLDNCNKKDEWNAWQCVNSYLGVLLFQSLDADQEQRTISPVYVYNEQTGFNNTLNSMMDHTWDGFYTGQLHKSMFPSLIQTTGNYTVMTTGTVPGNMRYSLRADRGAIKIHVPYWNAGSYQVKVNGVVIPYTPWDSVAGRQSELTGRKGCGENRFVGVQNFLEFWLTAGCTVDVVPYDAILANVRMQWTLAEFYAKGGVVSFTDRVSAALGIQAYQVKTVAVYQGSVIVQYAVTTASDDTAPKSTLSKLTTKLNALVSSPDASKVFGAPVLNATTNSAVIVGGNPKPTSTPTTTTVVTPAPIIQDTTTVTVPKVTTSTATATSDADAPKNNQTQVIVIVIVVLVLAVAAAVAVGVFIKNRLRKATFDAATASQEVASQGVIVQNSEIALEPQFNAEGAAFDIDIFTNKKRALKKFNDDEVAQRYYDDNNQFSSNNKLSATDAHSRIELTDVKAKK